MSQVRVHNITDRPNCESSPHSLRVAKREVRPGKHVTVDDSLLSKKAKSLHGRAIWIGDEVPAKYRATSKAALRDLANNKAALDAMSIDEARAYLSQLPKKDLLVLCNSMSPALEFTKEPSSRMLAIKLSRVVFSGTRGLDPESFFWLRRWLKNGDTYLER